MKVPVGVSNRHIHLTQEHVEALFGAGYQLRKLKDLKQYGQYAAEETVTLIGPKGKISNVRILGPVRKASQVEVSRTDSYLLGVDPPVRDSGDITGSAGLTIQGPRGEITIQDGVILAIRHIHFSLEDAERFGVKDKQIVSVTTDGQRSLVLENVLCRVNKDYRLEFHIDTDEANAAGLRNGVEVEVIVPKDHDMDYVDIRKKEKQLVLVLNCGSSSVKYKLYEMPSKKLILSDYLQEVKRDQYDAAIKSVFDKLSQYDIHIVSHRVVQGGEYFKESMIVNDEVKAEVAKLARFAPLHNPINLQGVEIAQKLCPNAMHVIVADTSFHQTMPPSSYLYALPYEYYEKYGIRKYGFHGTSHRYVMHRAEQIMETPKEKLRLVSCHIGSGASITAIRYGESLDTSMGMTPLAGLTMGTRSGDIDPAIIPYIEEIEKTNTAGAIDILNRKSGLLGVSGVSSDLRDVMKGVEQGDPRCQLAYEMYTTRIHTYIGLYLARLNGVDGIIFTAGVGENDYLTRQKVCSGLEFAGVILDQEANRTIKGEGFISSPYSPVKVMVIPTNEELVMATDAYQLYLNAPVEVHV
ncbi:acetate/propionate family kinase [Brevibacillus ginsengisoli]|uniref:acetate/propionate family kinase n=1 Tax=Brevibacillus ginsengisoli TaxID=363854 RepID=UPI003CEE8CA7